ncbi:hypothetical protein APA_3217 [Pseudanabaena sp. lw0831]|uniref:hypothetical protein n=1 Tax=Pseudanabaena sp. lw0831 TaxID=1357935 RepID=UPI0019160A53|nr:hypothetical protein [Pseudanabaena sp. lw0831]GBO55167.1 hypothetical protein APA_3217 [Pseudanabaena sp. lw0831]
MKTNFGVYSAYGAVNAKIGFHIKNRMVLRALLFFGLRFDGKNIKIGFIIRIAGLLGRESSKSTNYEKKS